MKVQSKTKPNFVLNIGKGKAVLAINDKTNFLGIPFLSVELEKNQKYKIKSFLITGVMNEHITTAKLIKCLSSLGFLYTSKSFKHDLIKDATLKNQFCLDTFPTKEDTVLFQNKKCIIIFHTKFLRSNEETLRKEIYIRLIYDPDREQIRVLFCETKKENYTYKLTYHPEFCQGQITCISFLADHNLAPEGRYPIRLSDERQEWLITNIKRQEKEEQPCPEQENLA